MLDAQYKINHLKNTLVESNKRVDNTVSDFDPKNIRRELEESNRTYSEISLKLYDLQMEVEAAKNERQLLKKEILVLKKDNADLTSKNNKSIKKVSHYEKQIKKHEQNNRNFFALCVAEKEEIFKYQLLVEKLKQEFYCAKVEIEKQESRYENLKNQLSYKLGNRLIGIKKPKDLLKFPKKLLDDYVDVKSKINNSSALALPFQNQPQAQQLPYISNKECTVFNKSATLPLRTKLSSIMFNKGIKGALDLQLYGVKPSASVDIELTIRPYQGDCTFRVMPDFKQIHHLATDEVMKINVTVDDDQAHQFINIISANGVVEVSFKKTRGVPSFVHLFQAQSSDYIEKDNSSTILTANKPDIGSDKLTNQTSLFIPELGKKSWIFRQAVEVQDKYGFAIADAFINKYVNEEHRDTVNVFYANNSLNDEKLWLSHINNYITSYDMQPIFLSDKKDRDVFFHLYSSIEYRVKDDTKITVIMPAYNAEKTIKHSIRSILNQTWENLELIVINDCSADQTLSIIKKLALNDSRIRVIDNPSNVGAYVSKNLGLKVATGNYITGHDADDWAFPQRLENHMKLIKSESTPPRASNTRMIRMEENGYLPLYPFGAFCHDGVMRVASITCMFEIDFLRNTLGGWDCSRFGADSEIINRCKMVIGDEFKNYKSLSMICLDDPNSLTNHPIHGVSKKTGISSSRKFYKDQWTAWQGTLDLSNVYLEFPHLDRKFEVPRGTEIAEENIISAIENLVSYKSFL